MAYEQTYEIIQIHLTYKQKNTKRTELFISNTNYIKKLLWHTVKLSLANQAIRSYW